jgi:hypothetical protein
VQHRWIIPFFFIGFSLSAAMAPATEADSASIARPIIAVVPFADYSGGSARDSILPLLESRLGREPVRLIPVAELRQVLRSFRIRSAGMISKADAADILSVRPVDFFLLGSVDFYIDGAVPEAGLSLRLVRASDLQIVWAKSTAANGEDFAGMFGLGRITSMSTMLPKLIESSLEGMADAAAQTPRPSEAKEPAVALVPFDNLTDNRSAGDIFTAISLSELAVKGYTGIEPGEVNDLFRRNNRAVAGGIDTELLRRLHDSLGVDLVITGTIDKFRPGTAGGEKVDPEIALGARCLDAATGKIAATYETSRRGADSEKLFKSGAYHCLGTLAQAAARSMLDALMRKKTS